ncbi:MAG: S-layer homology domain-containing protein, partial [Firmicutes bacterium]|nr:S-layer homology domain-containing protein [Bacillota bacterium]
MKKRIFSILLTVLMICTLVPATAFASSFTDVPKGAWYEADVEKAVALGLVSGRTATTYVPNGNLKYSEAVKLA